MQRYRPATLIKHSRLLSSSARVEGILGLRKEDPARIFERRAPLSPVAVKELIKDGHQVWVEKSPKRIYLDQAYQDVSCRSPLSQEVVVGVSTN